DEKVVAHPDEAERARYARLLSQRVNEAAEIGRQHFGKNLGFPPVIFPVSDDSEISGAHVCHRHSVNILCTGGMLPDGGAWGGQTGDSAWGTSRRPDFRRRAPPLLDGPAPCFRLIAAYPGYAPPRRRM